MSDVIDLSLLERDIEVEERMIRTYGTAMHASHSAGRVAIHVGQDGWDWCLSQVRKFSEDLALRLGVTDVNKLWGFPIYLEAAWPADRVVVRVEHEIEP